MEQGVAQPGLERREGRDSCELDPRADEGAGERWRDADEHAARPEQVERCREPHQQAGQQREDEDDGLGGAGREDVAEFLGFFKEQCRCT